MNVNDSSLAQISYSQMQTSSSVQAQSAQSGFSPETGTIQSDSLSTLLSLSQTDSFYESNEGKDNDGDDSQALNQFLNKQKNNIYPTSSQNSNRTENSSSQQDLQSMLMENIASLYSFAAKTYEYTSLDALTGGINTKA